MKRSPLKRSSKLMSKVSKKMSFRLRKYIKIKGEYLFRHGICEVYDCCNISCDIHHMKGRVGSLLLDNEYFMAVCRNCHTKIENNRAWAMEKGYSIDRLKK